MLLVSRFLEDELNTRCLRSGSITHGLRKDLRNLFNAHAVCSKNAGHIYSSDTSPLSDPQVSPASLINIGKSYN